MRPSILHNRASSARPLFQHSGTNVAKDAAPGPTRKHHIHKHAHCQSYPTRSRMHRKLARVAVGTSPSVRTPIPGLSRLARPAAESRNRSPKVVPAKRAHNPSSGSLRFSAAGVSSRLGSSGGHAWHVLARAVRMRKPGKKPAASLSETSTRSNLEPVVHVIDPAASSNHLGGSPAPMNLHLLSGAARRTMCSAAGRAAAAICRRARRASAGSRRSARLPCGCVSRLY